MVARIPSTTSAYVVVVLICPRPRSEAEVEDRLVEGGHVDRPDRREEPVVRKAGEEAVDGPLEIGDVALEPLIQAHVLEALRVQALLLPGQVREVLRRDRWPTR